MVNVLLKLNSLVGSRTTSAAAVIVEPVGPTIANLLPTKELSSNKAFTMVVCLCLTHPTSGIKPGGRMRCAKSSMSFVSATLVFYAGQNNLCRSISKVNTF